MEVVRAFQAGEVPCIVLKGPALADWLYGPAADRYSVDVDLLVASASLSAAEKVLRRLGYAPLVADVHPSDRPRYARVWHRDDDSANVDLHTTLAGVGLPSDEAWAVFSSETEPRAVGTARAEILAPGARALHVALHAAGHGPENPKSSEDLQRALELLPLEVWHEATALAMRLEAVPAFATGLALVPKGRELAEHLGVAGQSTVETALRVQRTTPLALGVEWLSRLPGKRAKIQFVASKVVPPPSFVRRWHPLARRGRLGLAAAYAYRPIWLLLRLGPAFVAWRRAKKESTRTG